MRAGPITPFGGPEVLDVVDVPEPVAGPGQKIYDVSTAGATCITAVGTPTDGAVHTHERKRTSPGRPRSA